MNLKNFLLICFVFLFVANSFSAEKRYSLPIDNSPYLGSEKAPVTIVEFIDYQ